MSADEARRLALGCPSCPYLAEVSENGPDASLSVLDDHIFTRHAGYNREKSVQLLAQARGLTRADLKGGGK